MTDDGTAEVSEAPIPPLPPQGPQGTADMSEATFAPPRLAVSVTGPPVTGPPNVVAGPIRVTVTVRNNSGVVDGFRVRLLVPPGVRVTPESKSVSLLPKQGEELTFLATLPDRSIPLDLQVEAVSEYGKAFVRVPVQIPVDPQVPQTPRWLPSGAPLAVQAAATGLGLLSDHPVARDQDAFDFKQAAARLARILLDSRAVTPFTIGIQGGWGAGKSSLMQLLLRAEVQAQTAGRRRRFRIVWFNAWTAEGSNALTALISSVLGQLDPSVLRRVRRRTSAAPWLTVSFVILANWLGLRRFADELWQQFAVGGTQRNEIRRELRQALSDWTDRDRPLDERRSVVVFVDDLDRCSPENITRVFEAIRLYLDAPGLSFVIGYDPAVVADALGRTTTGAGRTYLEKIIQVDYAIPPPDPQQAAVLADRCAREAGVRELLTDGELALIMERSGRNPRRFKRFMNTFVLSRQLDGSTARMRPEEHIKILMLRMYFPDFFRLLVMEPERDALRQLIELSRFRGAVTAGRDVDEQEVRWLFEIAGMKPPIDKAFGPQGLAQLEQGLPDVIVELSRNPDLFSLAWSLGSVEQRADLIERAREGLPTTSYGGRLQCLQCGQTNGPEDAFCSICGTGLERTKLT